MIPTVSIAIDDLLMWFREWTLSPGFACLMFTLAGWILLRAFYLALFGGPWVPRRTWRHRRRRTSARAGGLQGSVEAGRGRRPDEEAWSRIMWASDLAVSKDPRQAQLGKALLDGMARANLFKGSARSFLHRVVRTLKETDEDA